MHHFLTKGTETNSIALCSLEEPTESPGNQSWLTTQRSASDAELDTMYQKQENISTTTTNT